MLRAIGRSGGDALRRALLASAPTAQPSARGAQPFALRGLATAGAAGAGGWWARSCAVATEHLEGWRTAAAGWAPSAARSIATSTAASMAKPGNIKEHALLKDWMFEEMGIAKPGSEPKRRRSGAIAVKCGMTAEWNEHGVRVPLTVLWIDDCRVTQVKTQEKEGYTALQLGAGSKKAKRLNRSERGHFIAGDLPFSAELTEFRVSPDAILPVGTAIGASHFSAGQYVDIQGRTIGKGFQGPMKRWGFSGLPASHGTTKKHRAHGSIGNSQDPGRVWKGKKMAGRMGNRKHTVQSVLVYKVDADRNLLYVKGQVPGKAGRFLKITDALRKPPERPAYPAWGFGDFAEGAPSGVSVAKMKDPFITQSE